MSIRACQGAALMIAAAFLIPAGAAGADYLTPHDLRQQGWSRTDFSKRSVELSEFISGGPPKDGIPSIDSPKFAKAADERSIPDQEPVIGLEINGEARAYPIRVLMWHEIVNDTVGGVPVAVTYCPLCNSAIVFERQTSRGVTTFGTTGKLRHSDLVMYDRETETWWQQFTGRAIVGSLTGEKLALIPSRIESFALFKQRHPAGAVLVPNDRDFRHYGRNPYEGYDTTKVPFLYRGEFRAGIDPMARVVVVRDEANAFGITLELLRKHGQVSSGPFVVSWSAGQASALDHATVAGGRDVGNVVVRKRNDKGEHADAPYDVTFAFAFHAFHPNDAILQKCPAGDNEVRCGAAAGN